MLGKKAVGYEPGNSSNKDGSRKRLPLPWVEVMEPSVTGSSGPRPKEKKRCIAIRLQERSQS